MRFLTISILAGLFSIPSLASTDITQMLNGNFMRSSTNEFIGYEYWEPVGRFIVKTDKNKLFIEDTARRNGPRRLKLKLNLKDFQPIPAGDGQLIQVPKNSVVKRLFMRVDEVSKTSIKTTIRAKIRTNSSMGSVSMLLDIPASLNVANCDVFKYSPSAGPSKNKKKCIKAVVGGENIDVNEFNLHLEGAGKFKSYVPGAIFSTLAGLVVDTTIKVIFFKEGRRYYLNSAQL